MSTLEDSIDVGKSLGKIALYFGCWNEAGHYLHDTTGRHIYGDKKPVGLPWGDGLMDTGLLKNGKVPDIPDGKVYWTCGGRDAFWYAFYWWDRSVDKRGACNSGFVASAIQKRKRLLTLLARNFHTSSIGRDSRLCYRWTGETRERDSP